MKLHSFFGGLHLPENKEQSTREPIAAAPLPRRLVVPMRQHIGVPAEPVVAAGGRVLKGQVIGQPEGPVSVALHAPSSGTVVHVGMHPVAHPSGLPDLCVVIEPDGEDRWVEREPLDWRQADPAALRQRLQHSGVVGLGGAVFPTFVKLDPAPGTHVQTMVINGAECEPWITCDDMLMRSATDEVLGGIAVLRHALGAKRVLVGIEDNKPLAIEAMRAAARASGEPVEVVAVPTVYPGGGEKQLIKVLTGLEVPSGHRPYDVGVTCFNVGTARSVHRAVALGEPVISRIVTVTGNVARPRNYETLIGTPIEDLVALAGPLPDTGGYVIGGPMMGFELPALGVPVVKSTNCVIAKSPALFPPLPDAMPCIRCGKCAQVCPARLQPMDLYWFARARNFGKAQEYSLFDCIECGCCSYVCPSHIPLVDYYRYAKSEIWVREREKKASDLARERHEFHQFRLEREKAEKAERLAQKATAKVEKAAGEEGGEKAALVAAAIEKARARKAEAAEAGADTSPEAEIEKRRRRMLEVAKSAGKEPQ